MNKVLNGATVAWHIAVNLAGNGAIVALFLSGALPQNISIAGLIAFNIINHIVALLADPTGQKSPVPPQPPQQ